MVLGSSLQTGRSLDLSRGRWAALALATAVLATSALLLLRSIRASRSEARPADAAESAKTDAVGPEPGETDGDREAVVSSLPEDEQRLYSMISEAGGELLQMHIVSSGVFSKAKVTRLLDKLEGRGLVVRERHGMTNRVRIIR